MLVPYFNLTDQGNLLNLINYNLLNLINHLVTDHNFVAHSKRFMIVLSSSALCARKISF